MTKKADFQNRKAAQRRRAHRPITPQQLIAWLDTAEAEYAAGEGEHSLAALVIDRIHLCLLQHVHPGYEPQDYCWQDVDEAINELREAR